MPCRRHWSKSGLVRGRVVDARLEGVEILPGIERPGRMVVTKMVMISCYRKQWKDFRQFLAKNGLRAKAAGSKKYVDLIRPKKMDRMMYEVSGSMDGLVEMIGKSFVLFWEDIVVPVQWKKVPKDYRPDGSKPSLVKT